MENSLYASNNGDIQVLHPRVFIPSSVGQPGTKGPYLDDLHSTVLAGSQNLSCGRYMTSWGVFAHGDLELKFDDG